MAYDIYYDSLTTMEGVSVCQWPFVQFCWQLQSNELVGLLFAHFHECFYSLHGPEEASCEETAQMIGNGQEIVDSWIAVPGGLTPADWSCGDHLEPEVHFATTGKGFAESA